MDSVYLEDFQLVPPPSSGRQTVKMPQNGVVAVDEHEQERNFFTQPEIDALLAAAKLGRHGLRDYCMILLAYRHGFRVSELVGLKRSDICLDTGRIWVHRKKGGLSTSQPLGGDELRALRAYLRARKDNLPYAFVSSQLGKMTRQNFNYLVAQAADRASLGHGHPHMLRHSCGHILANKGTDTRLLQDWLGHRDIRHTSRYTRTALTRFNTLWGDS